MRTRPGSTTTKASCSRAPSFATASTTAAGLAWRARLWNFTRITPAVAPARVHQLAEVAVLCPENAPIFRHSARRSPKSAQISCFAVSRSDMKDCDEHMPVMSTCLSLNARSITRSSTAPLATSAIASTSWSAWRSAKITGPAQRSSARNFTLQRLVTAGPSESSTTSSWATLAAP